MVFVYTRSQITENTTDNLFNGRLSSRHPSTKYRTSSCKDHHGRCKGHQRSTPWLDPGWCFHNTHPEARTTAASWEPLPGRHRAPCCKTHHRQNQTELHMQLHRLGSTRICSCVRTSWWKGKFTEYNTFQAFKRVLQSIKWEQRDLQEDTNKIFAMNLWCVQVVLYRYHWITFNFKTSVNICRLSLQEKCQGKKDTVPLSLSFCYFTVHNTTKTSRYIWPEPEAKVRTLASNIRINHMTHEVLSNAHFLHYISTR